MTTLQPVQVRPCQPGDDEAWDEFVRRHAFGTVFHRPLWSRAVQQAYGHEPLHLAAWSQQTLAGVLPLFEVQSLFAGRVLVSIPYATYGGILAEGDDAAGALLEAASLLARRRNVQYLELRHREANTLSLPSIDRYDTFRKELPARAEDVMASLPRKARAAARKGLGSLDISVAPEHLDAVYDLYAFTLRRLGSPNYSRRFFHLLRSEYGDDCVCLLVRDAGKPVAGVISFVFRDEIVPYFSGSLPQGMHQCANNAMYAWLMEYAVKRGLRVFDFNRTRRDNAGPHDFKRFNGFSPTPLHYQVLLNKSTSLPNLSPSNRGFSLAGKVWRRLPLWLTRPAGARITKWIP